MISLRAAAVAIGLQGEHELREPDAVGAGARETGAIDEQTFTELHRRTERPLWAYLLRLTGHPQSADDISQESYLRFLSREDLPKDFHARKAYLFRIATRLVIDGRRRARFEGPWPEADEPSSSPSSDLRVDVAQAMAKLKPRERALLWLAYVEQYSHDEVAEIMDLRSRSVRVLLSRARKKLAKVLGKPSPALPQGEST